MLPLNIGSFAGRHQSYQENQASRQAERKDPRKIEGDPGTVTSDARAYRRAVARNLHPAPQELSRYAAL
jgi:hypothetical protein